MRRLGTNRRNRSASIAFPGDGGGGGGARSNENSNLNVTADKSKSRQDSPPLTLTRSERHYQSAGNVRNWTASDLEDISVDSWHSYHLRRFSVTTKGVVSRGDYLRYRRIRSRSLVPGAASELPCSATILEASGSDDSGISHQTDVKKSQDSYIVSKTGSNLSTNGSNNCEASLATLQLEIEEFGVYLVGSSGVGKTALAQQFATSEHILNFRTKDVNEKNAVTVMLDGEESRLTFTEVAEVSTIESLCKGGKPCAILVVYSITQPESFLTATLLMCQLHQRKYMEDWVVMLVGNKSDLVRSRAIEFEKGQSLAQHYKVKFIETSVGINYNVDELLVAVLSKLRSTWQKQRYNGSQSSKWSRFHRARSSFRKIFDRILKKKKESDSNCELLEVM